MADTTHAVLALGEIKHPDFAAAIDLIRNTPGVTLSEEVDPRRPCELVLVFQSRTGSVPPEPLEALHYRMPLAGKVVVLGTWCEGEARTGRPLVNYERIFWYQLPAWWKSVVLAWNQSRATHWQHPFGSESYDTTSTGRTILIDSDDVDAAGALVAACDSLGARAIWHQRGRARPLHSSVDAAIWVGAQLDAHEERQLAACRNHLGRGVPLVALLDFPRGECVRRAEKIGATAVLGKPWRLETLAAVLAG